jgi:hypothetical protein
MENLEKEYWLEVELQHPKGWSLTAEAGGITSGFFKISSKTSMKLDLKWEKQLTDKRMKPKIQPMLVINKFIENYAKKTRKKAEIYERGDAEVCGHKAYFARWKSDMDMVALSWVCDEEDKVFLINYYLEPGEEWGEIATWLIPGIVCHTSEKFWKYYLFGVEFKIPKGYKLYDRKLALGKPVMVFRNERRMLMLHWCYFAKEYLLKYKNLLEWTKKEIPKEVYVAIKGLNHKKLKSDETGKLTIVERKQSKFLRRGIIVKTVKIWYDADSNKIFLIGYSGPEANYDDLDKLEKSISFKME